MSRLRSPIPWLAALLTLALSLFVSVPAFAATPPSLAGADGTGERTWSPRVCAFTDDEIKAEEETTETEQGMIILNNHVLCWLANESQPKNPVEQAIIDAFLARTGFDLDAAREHHLGAVLCSDGGVGMVTPGQGLPTADDARKACETPVVPGGGGGGDKGNGGTLPDLLGTSSGMPSASSISCSAQGGANPYAQEAAKEPRVTDGDIVAGLIGSWLTGVGVMYGTAKGAGVATTAAGGGLALGAGSVGIIAWGKAASNALGELMESRYRDAAQGLADDAAHFALGAEANAQAAEQAAAASGSPEAQTAAKEARAAAEAAAKAAEAAKGAAKQAAEAKTRAEVAAAYEAAKKADTEAKKKAEEAAKAREKAQSAGQTGTTNTGGTGGSGTTTTPSGQSAESTCEKVRRQVWECEQGGWKSFSCQELARMLQGCRVDLTVALVDGDSSLCGLPTVSTEDLVRARDEACGLLVGHPMPGVDPCTTTVEGSPEIRGSCDPTIAYGGCPDEPDVVVMDDDTICFPAPPSAPPMPCVDPTPGGGPIVGETKTWSPSPSGFLQDSFGGVFVVSRGGIIVIGQGYPPHP